MAGQALVDHSWMTQMLGRPLGHTVCGRLALNGASTEWHRGWARSWKMGKCDTFPVPLSVLVKGWTDANPKSLPRRGTLGPKKPRAPVFI